MAEALSPRTDALDVIVELLGALDGSPQSGHAFYDRLCEACCRLGSMERAVLLLYDDARQLVVPVGSHGVEAGLLSEVYGTLEETPIAQVALSEDRVLEVTGDIGRWVPERYARLGGVETLCCVPVSAAGRWLGVIFTDRGGTRFELTDVERHDLWTLGRRPRSPRASGSPRASRGARACSRRGLTSRASSTSASSSGSSACRSCSARSMR